MALIVIYPSEKQKQKKNPNLSTRDKQWISEQGFVDAIYFHNKIEREKDVETKSNWLETTKMKIKYTNFFRFLFLIMIQMQPDGWHKNWSRFYLSIYLLLRIIFISEKEKQKKKKNLLFCLDWQFFLLFFFSFLFFIIFSSIIMMIIIIFNDNNKCQFLDSQKQNQKHRTWPRSI